MLHRKYTQIAQTLRRNMTPEERHLWYDFLKKLPVTVRRQHNIGNYIVDFYIAEKKIVIEIDGKQHKNPEGKEKDAKRDVALSKRGIAVLRYSNNNIRNQFGYVKSDILKHLELDISDLL